MFKKPRNVRRAAPSLNKLEIVYGSFSQAVPSSGNFSSNECFQAASFTFRPEELETGLPARFSLGDFRTTLLAGQFYRPNITGERGIRLYAVKYDDDDDDDDDTAPKLQRIVNNDAFYELLRGFCDSYEPGSTLNLLAEETEFRSQDRPPSASPLKSVVSDSHSTLRVGVPVSDAAAGVGYSTMLFCQAVQNQLLASPVRQAAVVVARRKRRRTSSWRGKRSHVWTSKILSKNSSLCC